MKRFAALFNALDATTRTGEKTAALAEYFRSAPEADRVWTIALLSGRRPKRIVNATELRLWAAEAAAVPLWLFEECYAIAGDLAETIARLLPPPERETDLSLDATLRALIAQGGRPEPERRSFVTGVWAGLGPDERFLFNKLMTGGFRMGVSSGLMTRALAQATGVEAAVMAHRLMGDWDPARTRFADLTEDGGAAEGARPYPFALASPLEAAPDSLGAPEAFLAEWKWDGIRGQIIARPGTFAIWSRGEDLITDRFPEFAPLQDHLPPGTVLDGEIVAWGGNAPLPFADLQKRIARKTVPKKLLAEAPGHFLAYDLLEAKGVDLRGAPLSERRAHLESLLAALPAGLPLTPSTVVQGDWETLAKIRATARAQMAEGLMLKRLSSPYHAGRKRGDWWKWKLDPFSVDAVMLYAQSGHGRRANLFTDFTFAVRDGNDLVPFTKAYSGLTDAEFAEITRWVGKHTVERFGPVRRVVPELVFEIGFEGIQASPRHKSGIALRFPRMLRWRHDKGVDEIDTLESLRALLRQVSMPGPTTAD
ncbi:ATP-dependent DNA ligase [Pseudotabrizicola algicola]|uniref:DNA ligase (ATP) n=1 Tax=Pseudotabrizicola algicola TaxID=2709381 RepID=A0A6B3RMV2_9RHOB|nr:ATP-dependent DNA ligase [Pseudotabrizicola algicola]NEX47380.1 ATP-dependent DNA ligase [Pseudotabrizicola algicola]